MSWCSLAAMAKKKPKRREPEPAATEQPLIFLDIDGVLAPFGGRAPPGPPPQRSAKLDADAAFAPFDEQCTQRLAAIVEATDARRSSSSSWRARADAVAVRKAVPRLRAAPLETVPADDGHRLHSVRQWEIARAARHPRDDGSRATRSSVDGEESFSLCLSIESQQSTRRPASRTPTWKRRFAC